MSTVYKGIFREYNKGKYVWDGVLLPKLLIEPPPPFFFNMLGESLKKRAAVDDPVPNPLPERAAIPLVTLRLPVSLPEEEADAKAIMSPVEPLVANPPPGLSIIANICCPHPFPTEDEEDEP